MKKTRIVVREDGLLGKVLTDSSKVEYFYPANYGRYTYDELEKLEEINFREANFEEKIEYLKKSFPWGEIIKIHTVGEYQIIEYKEKGEDGEIYFHVYIDFMDKNESYETLDKALTGVIIKKYEGPNSQLNSYLWRMMD